MNVPKTVLVILGLFGVQLSAFPSESADDYDELWVLIEINTYFRTQNDLRLVDVITEVVEENGLGKLDGHSSGDNQFDFNFIDVTNFRETKAVIEKKLKESYPQLKFRISKEYETSYENP